MQAPMMDAGDDDTELQKQLLDELLEFAKGGMAKDMAQRYGKPAPGAEQEEVAEDPDIPGVQTSAQDGEGELPPADDGAEVAEGEAGGGDLDQEKLRALLASMRAKGG